MFGRVCGKQPGILIKTANEMCFNEISEDSSDDDDDEEEEEEVVKPPEPPKKRGPGRPPKPGTANFVPLSKFDQCRITNNGRFKWSTWAVFLR